MPRPGQRPYECVRRVWHSDRHLPIRGSLIQEMFRLVNELHDTATKKNKEWQEKLPVVVLRAEEIMYSKASSEAEYVDLKTLRGRMNDAINTIIKREESEENGKLLQPCIEAALHLGCTARRSSRSERNNHPKYYLTGRNQHDPNSSVPLSYVDNKNETTENGPFVPQNPKFMAANKIKSFAHCLASDAPIVQRTNVGNDKFFCPQKCYVVGDNSKCASRARPCPSSSFHSVYPLYYGEQLQSESSNGNFETSSTPDSHLVETEKMCHEQNLSEAKSDMMQNVNSLAILESASEEPHEAACDLSLRLGPLVVPIPCYGEVGYTSYGPSKDGRKLSIQSSSQMEKDFFWLPMAADEDEWLNSSSMKRTKDSHMNVEVMMKKRKAIGAFSSENGHLVGS